MKQAILTISALGLGAIIAATGCSGADPDVVVDRTPHAIEDHECASCGMIVREQPSPRGQAVHRDGERVYFCSLADLVAYQAAPTPHGRLVATWVEALPVDLDPAAHDVRPQPWIEASEATFVLGVERNVMGTPALSYASEADARAAAERLGGRALPWTQAQPALERGHGSSHH